jgi:hypothetical protein
LLTKLTELVALMLSIIIVVEFVALAGAATSAGSGSTSPLSCAHEFPIEGNIPHRRIVDNIIANIGYCLIMNVIPLPILSLS